MMNNTESLIPRDLIFADPEISQVKISPNQQYLSYLAPHQRQLNLWLAPLATPSLAEPITHGEQPLKEHWWAYTEDHILYIHDKQGDENWQLHCFQLSTGQSRAITPAGVHTRVLGMSQHTPYRVLIAMNQRDKQFHDLYHLDLRTYELACIYQNNEYWDMIADHDLQPAIGLKVDDNGGEYCDIHHPEQKLARVTSHDLFNLYFYPQLRLGLSDQDKTFYFIQSQKGSPAGLQALEITSQHQTELGRDKQADVYDVLLCPQTKKPLAFAAYYFRKIWQALNEETQQDLAYLQSLDKGDIEISSQSADNQHWIIGFIHDNGPVTYYHYHRSSRQAHYLFDSHRGFKEHRFTKMHPRELEMRDGLKCVAYLSLPPHVDQSESGKPSESVPLILLVHGGPNFRDFWGFNPTHQWLANRGYAVLSINYRGSTGYGEAHFNAGHGEWAGKIHDDLLDAVNWAIQQNITTKDQVSIMGRSFGGYATLVGLTFTPEVFCCGVDIVGPANLVTMVKHFPPYWKVLKGAIHKMIGCDPDTPEGEAYLLSRSPLHYADRLCKPLLIGHGANDVRVQQAESDAMVEVLQKKQIPVTYAIFPNEGHWFCHPGNRIAFYALAEAFLAKSLGGVAEPMGNVDTSMVVKVDDFKLVL